MSVWSRLFGRRDSVSPVHPRDPVLAQMFGVTSGFGADVTPDTAMQSSAVYACVSLISETIAALPLHVMRRENQTTAKAREHPLYRILHDEPAPGLTSFDWREMMVAHTALRGDSYARIETNRAGAVVALHPLHPAMVTPERADSGAIRYRYRPHTGAQQVFLDDEVLRIPHKMMDGVTSLSPIALHRETIGIASASQKLLHGLYANNAAPKGALVVPTSVSPEAAKALRESWERRHQGPENAGKMAILDGGLDWKPLGMTLEDAQYVELQNFSVSDIARIFGVPPHKIGDLSRATFSNIEHQSIEFVQGTLLKWVRRIESRMNNYLLSQGDRQAGYYVVFDLKGLLRGDAAARAQLYSAMFNIGAMSPNEIRAAEDMNPYPGGDEYFAQGAAVPVADLGNDPDGEMTDDET